MRKTYHTDLSDSEWARIEPHLPVPKAPAGLGVTLGDP
jgi:transposase